MVQQWTADHVRYIIHRDIDPIPPQRRRVLPGESKVYIRVSTDLIARRGCMTCLIPSDFVVGGKPV